MMCQDFLLPFAAVHVGVDLGRRYVFVAEHLLDDPQVGSVLYQMSRKRMSEGVWRYVFEDACRKSIFLYDLEQGYSADGLPESVEEDQVVALCVWSRSVFHV